MFLAESYLHNLNPFVVQFSQNFGIRWYGVAYAIGFGIAWFTMRWVARKSWSPIPLEKVGDLIFAVIIGVIVGGRLGYAIFYDRHLFIGFSSKAPWWDLLAINNGGMASHGGMIGVILACWWFGKRHQIPVLHILDIGGLGALPGLCLGRIANFINGELWGKPLPDSMQSYVQGTGVTGADPPWWSIKYAQEVVENWVPDSDSRLKMLEPLRPLFIGSEDFYRDVVNAARHGDATVIQVLKPLLTAYYPSQIFQAITDGPILITLLALIWLRPRKPGVVGCWFLILYGILRIATEVFRQPDKGVPLTLGLLSRGQTLSLLMTLAGVVCLAIASRRNVARLGGLFKR